MSENTTITISSSHCLLPGDIVEFKTNDGRTAFMRITEVSNATTLTVRKLRWYEVWWYRIKRFFARILRGEK